MDLGSRWYSYIEVLLYVQQGTQETREYRVYRVVFTRRGQPDHGLVFDSSTTISTGIIIIIMSDSPST